jgi:hypothetical protein
MTNTTRPLPVAKWTHSSILKIHYKQWSLFLKHILNDPHYTKEEMNQRIDALLPWFKLVEHICINKDLTIKK